MKKVSKLQILPKLLKKIAPSIGAQILLEPEWGIAGQITFKSGRRSYFRYNTLDLNPVGASDIAKDKDYANFFMQSLGYPIVPGSKTFFRSDWATTIGSEGRTIDDAYAYAVLLGMPVIVKPNSGSQGTGVALVHTKREFYRAVRSIFKNDRILLVQKCVQGNDYRLVVLDNEVISAYERVPLSVVGDGTSSVRTLLEKKQLQFIREKRDTRIDVEDRRITSKLAQSHLTLDSVLIKKGKIFLLDNANLSTGGDSIDVTHEVHRGFKEVAIRLTEDMGLRFCGVDLMISGSIKDSPGEYWVIEINAAPGLDHYARSGKAQEAIVEGLYRKVICSIDS